MSPRHDNNTVASKAPGNVGLLGMELRPPEDVLVKCGGVVSGPIDQAEDATGKAHISSQVTLSSTSAKGFGPLPNKADRTATGPRSLCWTRSRNQTPPNSW